MLASRRVGERAGSARRRAASEDGVQDWAACWIAVAGGKGPAAFWAKRGSRLRRAEMTIQRAMYG